MSHWTLIAHPDEELRAEIERLVVSGWGEQAGEIVVASTANQAKLEAVNHGPDECALIVAGVVLPADDRTPLSEANRTGGIALVKLMRRLRLKSPVIFTAESADLALYNEMRAQAPSVFVRLGADWSAGMTFELAKLRPGPGQATRPPCFSLDMVLRQSCSWRVTGQGYEDGGDIYVDPKQLDKVRKWSETISRRIDDKTWTSDLSNIREGLEELFFEPLSNRKLYKRLIEIKTKYGGAQNTRIRFIVNEDTHPILLEALQDPDEENDAYWMLKAPIFRRYDRPGTRYPLFKDRVSRHAKINCLIIEADPAEGDLEAPWNTPLEPLPNVQREVQAIHEVLAREKESHGTIDKLEVLRAAEQGDEAVAKLETLLSETAWHLVHFAGHAVHADGEKCGIVLRAQRDGVMTAKRFATLLGKTQFLYLSSCKSADAYFVMNLVGQQVPSVLGFRWPVSDDGAEKYAVSFYESLFNDAMSRRFLEYAFVNAKRKVHDVSEDDPTWAAPLLVMQVDAAEDDRIDVCAAASPAV